MGQMDDLKRARKQAKSARHAKPGRRLSAFDWAVFPLDFVNMIKDNDVPLALMRVSEEGMVKSGDESYTRDGQIEGATGMRTAALLGQSTLTIDHLDSLPAKYVEKYGKELADPYPIGFQVDAQAVEADGKVGVEAIAVIENEKAVELINAGNFVGCSVEDYLREGKCDCSETECTCESKGHSFIGNTLVLEEVPNANGTWVRMITDEEREDLLSRATQTEPGSFERVPINQALRARVHAVARRRHALEDYMTEPGQWNDGAASAEGWLKEKGLDDAEAAEIGRYLADNPDKLTTHQLENLSADDFRAWYNSFARLEQAVKKLARRVATLSWLEHNAKPLEEIRKNIALYGQDEVNYGQHEGKTCATCRWYSEIDFFGMGAEGMCQIVSGDIEATMACDQHMRKPGMPDTPGAPPAAEPEQPEEPAEPEEEKPADQVDPDEDGNCPEGYTLSPDGTVCVRDDGGEDGPEMKETEPETESKKQTKQTKPKPAPGRKLHMPRVNPKAPDKPQSSSPLEPEVTKLLRKREDVQNRLARMTWNSPEGKELYKEHQKLTAEIRRLRALKKKVAAAIAKQHDALGNWGFPAPPPMPTLPAPEPAPPTLPAEADDQPAPTIVLEVWTLHGAVDDLCTQYEGTVWEKGTGPQPVADTHPNCKCTRDFHSSY